MKVPPGYQITPEILELIAKIDANRFYILSSEIPLAIKEKLTRQSTLKSSIFSAKIEGNSLTIQNIAQAPEDQKKIEIFNLLSAINFIEKKFPPGRKITEKVILKLHFMVMKKLVNESGHFRTKAEGLFNEAGMPVFLPPPPEKIPGLMKQLLDYLNSGKESFPLIKAMLAHFIFEQIHPFVDGNGRVGRLLVTLYLKSANYDFGVFVPFEEYIENHREEYYHVLDIGRKEPEKYLVFMLTAFYSQTEKLKLEIVARPKDTILLPPRREEIYRIIQDHHLVSFDSIRRRFLKIPERTLRYDIKKLVDQGLVNKVGATRGSYYSVKRENNVS